MIVPRGAHRALVACSFVLGAGCAHTEAMPTVPTTVALEGPETRVERLEAENRALSEEVRTLRTQLALSSCPAATEASTATNEAPRETVRISAATAQAEPAPEPTRSREGGASNDAAGRPVLRLYGSSALPLDGAGYITVRERLPPGPDVRPVPSTAASAIAPLPPATPPQAAPLPNVRPTPSAPQSSDPAQEEYRAALAHVAARRFHEANDELTRFLGRHPDHPYTDNALYWRGTVAYAERRYADARRDFERVVRDYAHGNKVADALYHLGMCHLRLGERETARTYFRKVQAEHPNTVAARLAAREDA